MSFKQQIIQFKKEHPEMDNVAIGKIFNRNESSIRLFLNPAVRARKSLVQKERGRRNKIILVSEKGGKCQRCGYSKYPEVLEFHHLNPEEKEFDLARNLRCLEILRKEIKKCLLLCPNCHREVHIEQKSS